MKALLVAVAAAALLVPLATSAQDRGGREFRQRGGERQAAQTQDSSRSDRGDRSGGRGRGFGAARQARTDAPQAAPQAAPVQQPAAQSGARFSGERQRDRAVQNRRGDGQRQFQGRGQRQAQADRRQAPSFAQAQPSYDRRGQGARGDNRFRDGDRFRGRYDNNRYANGRNEWRSDRRFADNRSSFRRVRAAPFRWPRGYSAVRWSIRQRLPSIFLSRSYFIDDFYGMGLPYPPPGAEWVRVGSDALLVDVFTGEILDIAYDAFYW
jgi:Ni/Co efflux regulator RcnB